MLDPQTVEEIETTFLALSSASREEFCIDLHDVILWISDEPLTDKQIHKKQANILQRILRNPEYDFEDEYVIVQSRNPKYVGRKDNQIPNVILLSDDGFKMLCMCYGGKKANMVRKYYIGLEKKYIAELRRNSSSEVLEVIESKCKELQNIREQSLIYSEEAQYWKSHADILHADLEKKTEMADMLEIECSMLKYVITKEQEKAQISCARYELGIGCASEEVKFERMREKYFKKIYVYGDECDEYDEMPYMISLTEPECGEYHIMYVPSKKVFLTFLERLEHRREDNKYVASLAELREILEDMLLS